MVEPVAIAPEPIGVIDAFVNAAAGSLLLPCDSTSTASSVAAQLFRLLRCIVNSV